MATLPAGNHCVAGTNTIRIGYEIFPLHSGCGTQHQLTFLIRRYTGWENVRTSCNDDTFVARLAPVLPDTPCAGGYNPEIDIDSILYGISTFGNGIALGTGTTTTMISNCFSSEISGSAVIDYYAWAVSAFPGTAPWPDYYSVPEVTGATVSFSGQ